MALSTGILTDVIEYLTEEIIFDKNIHNRYEKWEALEVRNMRNSREK